MSDDTGVIDKGWDTLPSYGDKPSDGEDAVTVSISTAPGEWLVNTNDAVVVPMSMMEVVEALRARRLDERSLVWRAGMQEWAPVDKVPQLKLAARLPSVLPPPSAPPMRAPSSVPSPPPPRVAPPPARAGRATLPFGSAPLRAPSNPLHGRPTPRPTLPPPPSSEEADVLAVYERPAATISFDLEPEGAPRRTTSPAPAPLETLAPMTTDSARIRTSSASPPGDDSRHFSAPDFRPAPPSSKRLVVLSSVGSAAAASLLTWWLSSSGAAPHAAAPDPVQVLAPVSSPLPPPSTMAPVAEPPPVADAAPSSSPPKPKAKRKARPWKPPVARPATTDAPDTASPPAEPNQFEIHLEEDDSSKKAKPLGADTRVEPPSAPSEDAPSSEPTLF